MSRLEEMEKKYSELRIMEMINDVELVSVDVKDLVCLIQNSFQQAERVEELEEDNKTLEDVNKANYWAGNEIKFENLRYKQALEDILNLTVMDDAHREETWNIIYKALEGEE